MNKKQKSNSVALDLVLDEISSIKSETRSFNKLLKSLKVVDTTGEFYLYTNGSLLIVGSLMETVEEQYRKALVLNALFQMKNKCYRRILSYDGYPNAAAAMYASIMESTQYVYAYYKRLQVRGKKIPDWVVRGLEVEHTFGTRKGTFPSAIENAIEYMTGTYLYNMNMYLPLYVMLPADLYCFNGNRDSVDLYKMLYYNVSEVAPSSMGGWDQLITLKRPSDFMAQFGEAIKTINGSADDYTLIEYEGISQITPDKDSFIMEEIQLESEHSLNASDLGGSDFGFQAGATDFSFSRINKRLSGEFVMPGTVGSQTRTAIIADISGSMTQSDYAKLLYAIKCVVESIDNVDLYWCNDRVVKSQRGVDMKDVLDGFCTSTGGTSMLSCIDYILDTGEFYSTFVVITDGGTKLDSFKHLIDRSIKINLLLTNPGVPAPPELNPVIIL